MPRDFFKLTRRPMDVLRALRYVTLGSAIATTGLAVTPSLSGATASQVPIPTAAPTVTIVDRSRKAAKLILRLPSSTGLVMTQHRSHQSHSSHRSHSSHFSSTTGTARTPAPLPPAPASPPVVVAPPVSEDTTTAVVGSVAAIDREERSFVLVVGETGGGIRTTFEYRDDTRYQTALGVTFRFDDFADANSDGLPITAGDRIQVTWRTSPDGETQIATTIKPAQ